MIRSGIRWWLLVATEHPVRRTLSQTCAVTILLCTPIALGTAAALLSIGAATRSLVLVAIIPVWLTAWLLNRRGSPLGAILMSYSVMVSMLVAVEIHRYLVHWSMPIVIDAPLLFPVIVGLFSMGPRHGIYLTFVEILAVLGVGFWESTEVDRLVNFALFGSMTLLPLAGLLALITYLYLRAIQTASDTEAANQHLRAYLLQAEDLAIEQERIRVAREIHDGLGHHLSNINIHSRVAHRCFETDRPTAVDSLVIVKTEIGNAQRELRRAIDALVSDAILAGSLEDVLAAAVRDCTLAGIRANLQVIGTPRPLSEQITHTLYRIGQEAVNNIRQHSHAKHATVTIDYQEHYVRIIVEDDGVGLQANDERRRGHGLDILQERAALVDGKTEIEVYVGQGVRIVVEIPI
jgi:signal transduction histidine kinase